MQHLARSATRITTPVIRSISRSVAPTVAACSVPRRQYASSTPRSTDISQTLQLLESCKQGDIRRIAELIKTIDVNAGDYDKRRPLHLAAGEGQLEVVKILLDNGAEVNAEDRWGWTPLNEALFGKHDACISLIRSKGGKLSQTRINEIVSLMCQAAAEGNVQQLQRLYDAGVDMNLSDYDLRTPLHVAASDGHLTTVDFLIKHGARVNVVDRFGNTPLGDASRASAKSKKSVIQLLISHGGALESDWDIGRDALLAGSVSRSLQFLANRVGAAYVECYMPGEEQADFSTNDALSYCTKEEAQRLSGFLASPPESLYPNSSANLLGRVWQQKQPMTFDLTEKDMPHRFKEAKAAGLKYGMIIPLKNGDKIFGLLKLYSFEPLNQVKLSEFTQFASGLVSAGLYKKGKQQTIHFASELPDISKAAMQEVYERIVAEEVFNANLVYSEVDWFFGLGLQKYYFERFTPAEIANHIHSFIAAKKLAATTGKPEEIMLNIESAGPDGVPDKVLCMCPAEHSRVVEVEKIIQGHIAKVPKDRAYTLEFFMSQKPLMPGGNAQLGLYVLETSNWANPAKLGSTDTNLNETASTKFLRTKTKAIKERYQQIMTAAVNKISPFAEIFPVYRDGTIPLMFAFFQGAGTTTSYVLQLTELLKHNNLIASRKFVETFANGIIVFSLYLQPVSQPRLEQLLQQFSMLHLVPESLLTPRFLSGQFSAEQYTYASAATRFVYYFLNKRSEEFDVLAKSLKNDPLNLGRLRLLQTRLKREAISHDRIIASITNHPSLVTELYADFHRIATTPRAQNASTDYVVNSSIAQRIKNEAQSLLDGQVLSALLVFNAHMLKTNFYNKSKAALSFRLDPKFLIDSDLPQVPFGLFFVMGSDFQGFHLRFRDVARGGIRVIRSQDRQAYNTNLETLFAENFGLAYTQNKKNKDIPEFGSKGTILLNLGNQANPFLAFQKYTSGLLDCIIKSGDIVDNYGKEEILFLGPDEGTADYMEWAARYAAKRGYKFWRAFTTGKPPSLGGIPHDKFGMTTRSVHRYVVNCLKKLNLQEEKVTKFQTGGPDGDLGSNEILLSKDRTLAMVDGSGVIYDPNGLDRSELQRLARARTMIKNYDIKKLSPGGFRVLTSDTNITLPSGENVPSGLVFRNEFHLHPLASADLFVPCGGRPESVNLTNVHRLFDSKGLPRFKIIVEGANLFFTQDARMVLENAGVVLYKDASANKGGVTSSSLEVLAALSLDAEQFEQHMAVKDEKNMPTFYKEYVAEIQQRIEHDADLEFECIWKEHERTQTHRYLLTDQVSDKINQLNDFVQSSSLWHNLELRNTVLQRAIPKKLTELVGLPAIIKRVPEAYIQAIFGAHLASRYVYKHGLDANEFAFFEFMQDYLKPQGGK